MQYTYKDEDQYVFMDMDTFEECRCPSGDFEKFITEGMTCSEAAGRESNRCGTAGESDVGSDDDRSWVEREHASGGDKPR